MAKTKTSRAARMRKFFKANPSMSVADVAKHFGTRYQIAYMIKKGMEQVKTLEQKAPLWQPPKLLPMPEVITTEEPKADSVNHPAHYKVGGIETIDFIEAKKLGYNLGNVIKYVTRADHKANTIEDLCKARWYLNREIARLGG